MSAEEQAGPSKKRVRVESDYDNSYCGLDRREVRQIKTLLTNDDLLGSDSEEEPFIDSGSEYLPSEVDTDEQESENEVNEISFEDINVPDVLNNDNNLDADVTDYRDLIITWTKHDFVPKLHAFDDSNSGVKNEHLTEGSPEIDFFLDLFTEDIAQYIVVETNRYAIQKKEENWRQLNLGEFFTFIALTMLMTRNKKLEIKENWSVDPLLYTPAFGKYMARDRYLKILKNLHFANNEDAQANNNRLHKVQYVLEEIKRRFKSQFYPFQNLVIDESMILFKGRLSFKQYIKTKRHRFGIKLYVLCDCESGIVLDFVVYIGKDTYATQENITGLGASGNVVAMLMESYLNNGHSLYTDNFYSSPILSNYLFERMTNSCGTVRSNRMHMPKIDEKLKKGDVAFRSSDICLVVKWKDRRDVTMITTMHENKMITLDKIDRATNENIKKPMCVVDYNSRMGAVDRSDMLISSIDSLRKCIKWFKKLFVHTLDICVLNSHGMFSTKHPIKYSLAKFQLNLIRQLLERYGQVNKPTPMSAETKSRLSERHFPTLVPATDKTKSASRRCIVCSQTNLGEKKRRVSRYMCKDCDVGLCVVPCFQEFHTKAKF